MSKLSALVIVALFLGGAGTGMGGVLLYQFATGTLNGPEGPQGPDGGQGIPGLPGTNGTDGTDGSSGPQQLSGVYEGDHIWSTAIVPANETVVLRNGNFFGDIFVYGNLTIENGILYHQLWPLGNATVLLNNTLWDTYGWWPMVTMGYSQVTIIGTFGFASLATGGFQVIARELSQVHFLNCSMPNGEVNLYLSGASEVHIDDITYMGNPQFDAVYASDFSSLYIRNAAVGFGVWLYNNASLHAWNATLGYSSNDLWLYDNSSLSAWNTSFEINVKMEYDPNLYVWESDLDYLYMNHRSNATLRSNTVLNTLQAHSNSTIYLYQSEGCVINIQNLFDNAQVITL